MRPPALALLLTFVLAGGCLSMTPQQAAHGALSVSIGRLPDPGLDFSHAVVGDHGVPGGHAVRELHHGSFGMELVGHNDLTDKLPPGAVGSGWGAVGLWTTYACVAQLMGSGGIAIVDLEDPARPAVVSQVGDGFVGGDCQFTQDGAYLFAGAYMGATPTAPFPVAAGPLAMGSPGGTGLNVWDVRDKANPRHLLFSDTGEYHTLMLHTTPANVTYVVQAYSGHIYRFDPDAPSLTRVATATPMDHDMWVARHPITGQTLLYSGSFSDGGFVIHGFDDPERPSLAGAWKPDGDGWSSRGWHRQASVDQLVDGRALVVVAGEKCPMMPEGGATLPYTVVDVTDPAAPFEVGAWQVPGEPVSGEPNFCTFSPHEFSVRDGYVVSGNYHAGVWLWDVGSAGRMRHPATLAYFLPDREPALSNPLGAQDLAWGWTPWVWGASFDDRGYVIATDFSSGLYVLKVPGITQEA